MCFSVDLKPLKHDLKKALNNKIKEVGTTLKNIVKEKCKSLEDYANIILEQFKAVPDNIDALKDAGVELYNVNKKKDEMVNQFEDLITKN